MRPSIDFRWVKSQVPPERAFELLDLAMRRQGKNQWRGGCPACNSDRTLVYTDGEGFICHTCDGYGGDQIALARFVLDLPGMYEGALDLANLAGISLKPSGTVRSTVRSKSTVRRTSTRNTEPESERARRKPPSHSSRGGDDRSPPQPTRGFDPDEYAAKLDYEHELLISAGADIDKMREHCIGYCSRGTHRGMIVIRVGDEYIGVEGTIHLPQSLKSTVVVPIKRRA